jgi:hypothetical protein
MIGRAIGLSHSEDCDNADWDWLCDSCRAGVQQSDADEVQRLDNTEANLLSLIESVTPAIKARALVEASLDAKDPNVAEWLRARAAAEYLRGES